MFRRPARIRRSSSGPPAKRTRLNPSTVTRRVPKSVEIKQEAEVPWDNVNITAGGTALLERVANIAAGDGPTERNGRAIKILGHRLRMRWYKQNDSPQAIMRIIIFRWGTGIASPTTGSILDLVGVDAITADYNIQYRGVYKILADKTYTINDFAQRFDSAGAAVNPSFNFIEQMVDIKVEDPHIRTFYEDIAAGSASSSTWVLVVGMNLSGYINESNVSTDFLDI